MKRVITALILIPLVLALMIAGPLWMVSLISAAVAALAAWECLGLCTHCGANPPRIAVLVAVFALFLFQYQWPDLIATAFGMLSLGLLIYCTFRSAVDEVMVDASSAIFTLIYSALTLTAVPALRAEGNGPSLVVFLMCAVWAGDIAALYVGRTWGRRKLAPTLSPNKTWEGSLGSVAGSLLVTGLLLGLAALLERVNLTRLSYRDEEIWYWLVLAVVVNVAAQIGDLAESALKRSAGVKDSGNLVPGHGGVLDRIDALLLAAPVLWYFQVIHQRF